MKGKELKEIIRISGLMISEIVDSSAINKKDRISTNTLLTLYRDFNLEKEITTRQYNKLYNSVLKPYIDKYLVSTKTPVLEAVKTSEPKDSHDFKHKYVSLLEKQNADLEKKVKDLDILNRQTAYNIPTLIDEIKRMSKQIESLNGVEHLIREALETGALKKK